MIIKEYEDDGLYIPDVNDYSLEKYKLIMYYADMFVTSMRNKWGCLVYLDLFAGAGLSRIKQQNRIVNSSSLISLNLKYKFGKYIFCEADIDRAKALKDRTERLFPGCDISVINTDVNKSTERILGLIPKPSRERTVLTFCVVDPFNMGDLEFSTIKGFADNRIIDFMVLIPSYMDVNRNLKVYSDSKNTKMATFLGDGNWREHWSEYSKKNDSFGAFISDEYTDQMVRLGYLHPGRKRMVLIRNPENNSPLYDLIFFSKNELGLKFWDKARRGCSDQLNMFD